MELVGTKVVEHEPASLAIDHELADPNGDGLIPTGAKILEFMARDASASAN